MDNLVEIIGSLIGVIVGYLLSIINKVIESYCKKRKLNKFKLMLQKEYLISIENKIEQMKAIRNRYCSRVN